MITLATFELTILAAVQILHHAAEGAMTDYYVWLLRTDHVGGGMLFWSPFYLINVLSHFEFFEIDERVPMNPVLAALAFTRMTEIDWSSSRGPDEFVTYDFCTGTLRGYPAERLTPIRR